MASNKNSQGNVDDNVKYDDYGFRVEPVNNNPPDELKKNQETNITNKKKTIYTTIAIILFILFILSCFLAGFIAWNCYSNNLTSIRFAKTVISTIFPYLYLPYFFLLRVILKQPCF